MLASNELPDELKHLISLDDFNLILTFSTTYLTDKGYKNISFSDGFLLYDNLGENEPSVQANFLNLVKTVIGEERKDWQMEAIKYLDSINQDQELEHDLLLNFEKAKEYLTVRLHPRSTYKNEPQKSHVETLVYKIDIPETYSLLALDLPRRFHFMTIDEITVWDKKRKRLFEIAHNNLINKIDDIKVRRYNLEGAIFYTLFDTDYSSAYCIDFANNCNNLIGQKGSIVSFPTKGSVFVHPISNREQFNICYNHIAKNTIKFFDDDPGPISRNLYWFYKNKFNTFQTVWNNRELTYIIPSKLLDLLKR